MFNIDVSSASGHATVVGYYNAPTGLSYSTEANSKALCRLGINVSRLPIGHHFFPQFFPSENVDPGKLPEDGLLLIVVNPPRCSASLDYIRTLKPELATNALRIGYWAWELPEIPDFWIPEAEPLHQIWVPSEFVRQAVLKKIPHRADDIRVVPHPVPNLDYVRSDRKEFRLPEDKILITAMLHMKGIRRKNPRKMVRAFKIAAGARQDVNLVLKITGESGFDRENFRLLLKEITGDPRIIIVRGSWHREKLYRFMKCADIYLSLHAAEGFGLTMAEMMRLGIPVVGTGFSANLDFMNKYCARLVRYRLKEIDNWINASGLWADPGVYDAACNVKKLLNSPNIRHELGQRGREHIASHVALANFAQNIPDALYMLGARQKISPRQIRTACAGL